MVGDRGKQSAELARWWSGIRPGQIKRKPIFEQAVSAGHGQGAVAQSVTIKLQSGEAIRVTPKTGGDEVQRVFKIAALCLKIVRAKIHPFSPDGFIQEC